MRTTISTVRAVMKWRVLVNFRIQTEAAKNILPSPFRPKLVNGWAMAGICLIRLEEMRPAWLPRWCGVTSENAAHRIAVQWTENGRTRDGVFIPRRDTNSFINRVAGGRIFPGVHHPAHFGCNVSDGRFHLQLRSLDGETRVAVAAQTSESWPCGSTFKSLVEASDFFKTGRCGWSPSNNSALDGTELHTETWAMSPLTVDQVESSFFGDQHRFPPGTVEFDSALLMRGIEHEWRALKNFSAHTKHQQQHHGPAAFFQMP